MVTVGCCGVPKFGGLIVDVVEDVTVLCAVGRRFAWDGMLTDGEAGAGEGEGGAPSNGDGDGSRRVVSLDGVSAASSSSGDAVRRGDAGATSSLLLALLVCLDGEVGMLRLLDGRANGLVGRSEDELICDGRRTKGLVFSGESEAVLVGERPPFGFVGDCVGGVARAVAGEALFCRLKGDWRPESKESGDGRSGLA